MKVSFDRKRRNTLSGFSAAKDAIFGVHWATGSSLVSTLVPIHCYGKSDSEESRTFLATSKDGTLASSPMHIPNSNIQKQRNIYEINC